MWKRAWSGFIGGIVVLAAVCGTLTGCGEVKQVNDSLTIYYTDSRGMSGTLFKAVLDEYQKEFPDIPVTVEYPDQDTDKNETAKKLQTELMAGKGPDLIFDSGNLSTLYGMDIEKMMNNKVFWDAAARMWEDPDWNAEDYRGPVLAAGAIEGAQYLFPVSYNIETLHSTKELLNHCGFSTEAAKTLDGYLEECDRALKMGLILYDNSQWNSTYYNYHFDTYHDITQNFVLPMQFPNLLNPKEGTLNLNTPQFEKAIDVWKKEYQAEKKIRGNDYKSSYPNVHSLQQAGETVWDLQIEVTSSIHEAAQLQYLGESVMTPLTNAAGGVTASVCSFAAVSASSANLENAWQFIKVALRKEVQDRLAMLSSNPVRKESEELYFLLTKSVIDGVAEMEPDDNRIPYASLPDSNYADYRAMLEQVNTALIDNTQHTKVLAFFVPYLEGEASYESCAERAESYYKIYASE